MINCVIFLSLSGGDLNCIYQYLEKDAGVLVNGKEDK